MYKIKQYKLWKNIVYRRCCFYDSVKEQSDLDRTYYVLPEGKKYKLELIDTRNMTVEELPEVYEGKIRIRMGARQYMAVRMKEVK